MGNNWNIVRNRKIHTFYDLCYCITYLIYFYILILIHLSFSTIPIQNIFSYHAVQKSSTFYIKDKSHFYQVQIEIIKVFIHFNSISFLIKNPKIDFNNRLTHYKYH